jgi:hypothetical protein
MSAILKSAKPLTEWRHTANGVRYRWIALDKGEITALREQVRDRSENTQLSDCKAGK